MPTGATSPFKNHNQKSARLFSTPPMPVTKAPKVPHVTLTGRFAAANAQKPGTVVVALSGLSGHASTVSGPEKSVVVAVWTSNTMSTVERTGAGSGVGSGVVGVMDTVSLATKPLFSACISSVSPDAMRISAIPDASVAYVSSPAWTVAPSVGVQTGLKPPSNPNSSTVTVVVAPTIGSGDTSSRRGKSPSATSKCSPSCKSCLFNAVSPYARSVHQPQKRLFAGSCVAPPATARNQSSLPKFVHPGSRPACSRAHLALVVDVAGSSVTAQGATDTSPSNNTLPGASTWRRMPVSANASTGRTRNKVKRILDFILR